jgi:signal transduction histidine kinase
LTTVIRPAGLLLLLPSVLPAGEVWSWLNPSLLDLEGRRAALVARMDMLPASPAPQGHERAGFHSGFAGTADSVRWVQVDLGKEMVLDSVVVVPAFLGGSHAYGFPQRFRVDVSNDGLFAEATTLLDQTQEDAPSSLEPWHMKAGGMKARFVRFTATKLSPQPGLVSRLMFALGELMVFSGGRNVALGCPVEAVRAVETLPTWSPRHLVDGTHALGLPVRAGAERTNGWHSAVSAVQDAVKWVQVDFGMKRQVDEIRLIPAHPADYPDRSGFGFPIRFKVETDEGMVFDGTARDFTRPGDTPVVFPMAGHAARTVRVTATRLVERSGDFVFALAELQAFAAGTNIAAGGTVTSLDETRTLQWRDEHLVDGLTSSGTLIPEPDWLAALSERRELTEEQERLAVVTARAGELARQRAWWLAAAIAGGSVIAAWMMLMRLRRMRHEEMETLRQRISRDLHDEIGSHLGSIRLMSELALREQAGDEPLQEIHRLAGEAAESMRGIIWLVREGGAPRLGSLIEAMRQSAASLLKGCAWTLETSGDANESQTASLEFHRQVFLFFREAAHNIQRHAAATVVKIEAGWRGRQFHLRIEDNGRGFDEHAVKAGNGLANLRHRAEVLGGVLRLASEPGKGTCILIETPLS